MTAVLNPELDGDFNASVTVDLPPPDDDGVGCSDIDDVVAGSPIGVLVSLIIIRVHVWRRSFKKNKKFKVVESGSFSKIISHKKLFPTNIIPTNFTPKFYTFLISDNKIPIDEFDKDFF